MFLCTLYRARDLISPSLRSLRALIIFKREIKLRRYISTVMLSETVSALLV